MRSRALRPLSGRRFFVLLPVSGPDAVTALLGNVGDFASGEVAGGGKASPNRWRLQDAARRLLPEHKGLGRCCRSQIKEFGHRVPVQVWAGRDGDKSRAWFSGLIQCGAGWICPVCAAKISNHRRDEAQLGLDLGQAAGMGLYLITLTFRHGLHLPLAESLPKFAKALRMLKSGREAAAMSESFGTIGEIRALEVTHGANGWHPHTHAVTFTKAPLRAHDVTRWRRRLFVRWYRACEKVGLPLPSYRHGVRIDSARHAADYVTKWGFADEVTAHLTKGGRRKDSRTSWQLLSDYAKGDDRQAGALWREFALMFKGKAQLRWSPGLRQALGFERIDGKWKAELTDQEVLGLPESEPATIIASIDATTWRGVLRFRARAEVLDMAANNPEALPAMLDRFRAWVRDSDSGSKVPGSDSAANREPLTHAA